METTMKSEMNNSNSFLTGNKDVDRTILQKLSDRELLIACQSNTYAQENVCDETFFRNLVFDRYPETIKYKDYVKTRDWKNFYLSIVYYVDKLNIDYELNYFQERNELKNKDLSPELEYLSRKIYNSPYKKIQIENRLIWASEIGNLPVVKYLTERGANIHDLDDYALRQASINGHLPVVKYLVEHNANINAKVNTMDDALTRAIRYGHLPVVEYLTENGADIHTDNRALRTAVVFGHLSIVKYLKDKGVDIHGYDNEALQFAISYKHNDIKNYILEN